MIQRTLSTIGRLSIVALLAVLLASPAAAQLSSGIDTTHFDHSVRPQDDFFRYVNGGWLKKTQIPADASSWGAFQELSENSRNALHALFESASTSNAPAGSARRKVGDLYASYMDSARVEQRGLTPLQPLLTTVAKLQSKAELPATFASLARVGIRGPAGVRVSADPKHSSVNIVQVSQSGLGLPDRDYYLKQNAKMEETRAAYVAYITKMMELAKQPDPAGAATRILALETAIATPQWARARNRDRDATYNKMTVARLAALTPSFNWKRYLAAAGLSKATDVIVRQPDYVQALDPIFASTPVATWREYLTFKVLDSFADVLPAAFVQANFEFHGHTLSGQEQLAPRWKRAVNGTNRTLGEAAGALYAAKYFKPEAKARMAALVKNLINAYKVGIDSLEWMSPATKAQAKAKLALFTVKIGAPDTPRDYSALRIVRSDLFGNELRNREFEYADMAGRLGKPVDKSRWGMTAPTVNAQYSPTSNDITFPAGILQPPFFNVHADDAVNYGAIGAVIGHEIGHGFDDQGRKSDGHGNLRDWWTPADAKAYEARTAKFGAQYDAINPIGDLHINGKLTMGENIGDLSGLAQAYRAYHISLHGKPAPVIDGLTGDQRFFIGFAQIWRGKMRDDALRRQLLTNPHSPGKYRAFVPLVNNDAFEKAFNVQPGDGMYLAPKDRVKIW
ncbi:MAG TPA: M13 family metallopeptidase [Gemmatimonadaceae bacterium]|nr:M13 family metallopeptidase [Gemmatimonadaceae bacterium]